LAYDHESFLGERWLARENISDEDQRKFQEANQIFVGAMHNALSNHMFDLTLYMTDAKTLWDYLNANYSASDAGKELYIMESFYEYKVVAK
jgi:hypothetical protein